MDRKLAAILAADVAGYSRLMGGDEEGTLATLRAHREVVDGLIAGHRGRVFNTAGDSVVAEFPSAVEATLCAVAIQQELGRRNEPVPKDKRLEFRIGINIGDVMVEGGNLFGDGVNVADRVQKLAEPGGICVARNVHDHLRNKVDFTLEPMGEHRVKNIATPVAVYRVLAPGAARRPLHQRWAAVLRRHRRLGAAAAAVLVIVVGGLAAWPMLNPPVRGSFPKLAVLPFEDFTGGAAPAHYSEGVSEDLITLLSRFPDITVVSRNSSFAYKDKEIDPVAIGSELKVDYVVEGSVQKKGAGLRINAQLIDTHTNLHVWAEAYEGSNPSSLQDEAARRILVALPGEDGQIRKNEYKRIEGKARADFDEYDYYLSGHEIFERFESLEEHDRAGAIWEEGLKKFPDSALLRLWLAWYHFWRPYQFDAPKGNAEYRQAGELARAALAKQNLTPMEEHLGRLLMAYIHWHERDFVHAVADAEATVALSPYNPRALSFLSRVQIAAGNTARAIEWLEESTRRDPTIWRNTRLLAWAYYLRGEYKKSIAQAQKHLELSREYSAEAQWYMAASYVRLGNLEGAHEAVKKLQELDPKMTLVGARSFELDFPYKDRSMAERELGDLAQVGLPELPFGYDTRVAERLSADEIRVLILGHTISGRDIKTSETFTDVITADGVLSETADWGPDTATLAYLDKNSICFLFNAWGGTCGAIFRNPQGTSGGHDEFHLVYPGNVQAFSVVK